MNKENQQEQELKNKVEEYDMDHAISDLSNIIHESADMYQQLKKIKFDYITQTCELFSRIDLPTMMMEHCRRDIAQNVPSAKSIAKVDFNVQPVQQQL